MIEWKIAVVAICGALAGVSLLVIVLEVIWTIRSRRPVDPNFPHAHWRRKRKRGAAKRPVQSVDDVD